MVWQFKVKATQISYVPSYDYHKGRDGYIWEDCNISISLDPIFVIRCRGFFPNRLHVLLPNAKRYASLVVTQGNIATSDIFTNFSLI